MRQLKLIFLFSLILISFLSSGQINLYKEIEILPQQIDNKSIYCTNHICMYLTFDNYETINLKYYSKTDDIESSKIFDTIDYSVYYSKIHFFQTNEKDDYVMLWETEYENYPELIGYYLKDGKIEKIGNFGIILYCEECDEFTYPIDKILISKINTSEISFLMLEQVSIENAQGETEIYNPSMLKFIYNKDNKSFFIEKNE